jgi:DNA (cytosine-5)-methyltransferase 1
MVELGYGIAYRVLDAQFFGLAQRRKRVFVVGYSGDWRRAVAVLFEREALAFNGRARNPEISTACFAPSSISRGFGERSNYGGIVGTLQKGGSETDPAVCFDDGISRYLTPMEWERLFGFADNYTLIPWRSELSPDGHRYNALGNTMAVPVMAWIGKRIQMVEEMA